MNQLRLNYNKPLYHEKEDIMVLWQAKSGCTMVKKMFFHHEGILDEILKKHNWIHDFNYSEYYIKTLNENTKIIQFVRCPFERAVSSYIHVNRTQLKKFFKKDNLTFREFIYNIKDVTPNDHYGKQLTPYKYDKIKIYKIEELNIEELNKKYNLNYKFHTSSHYVKRTNLNNSFSGDKRWEDIKDFIPQKYTFFYDEEIKNIVEELYKDDLKTFNYSYEDFLNRNK